MKRSDLRALVIERSWGICEWPGCLEIGAELAHLHSIGMGGRASADTPSNVAFLCFDHSRISDSEYGSGGADQYREAHLALGVDLDGRVAYERAEVLRAVIAARQGTRLGPPQEGGAR